MTDKIAVVFGGSGFVGRHVVRELAARGWRVRVAVRHPAAAHFLRPLGTVGQVDVVQANVRYRSSVQAAISGASAVVNLVAILAENGAQKFQSIQVDGARNIAEMTAAAGITNMVHVSAIGANATSESKYARTKAEGEAFVRQHVPTAAIIRPSIIFGPQDQFFNRFAAMTRIAPALPLIGGGKTKFQPIYVDDVADCIAEAIDGQAHGGLTYELGGPDVHTFKELMQLMLRIIGRRRILAPLPFPVASLMGKAGDVASIAPFIQAPITADQVIMLQSDNVVGLTDEDDMGTIDDFDVTPTTLAAILPGYLARFRKAGQFSPETA